MVISQNTSEDKRQMWRSGEGLEVVCVAVVQVQHRAGEPVQFEVQGVQTQQTNLKADKLDF